MDDASVLSKATRSDLNKRLSYLEVRERPYGISAAPGWWGGCRRVWAEDSAHMSAGAGGGRKPPCVPVAAAQ